MQVFPVNRTMTNNPKNSKVDQIYSIESDEDGVGFDMAPNRNRHNNGDYASVSTRSKHRIQSVSSKYHIFKCIFMGCCAMILIAFVISALVEKLSVGNTCIAPRDFSQVFEGYVFKDPFCMWSNTCGDAGVACSKGWTGKAQIVCSISKNAKATTDVNSRGIKAFTLTGCQKRKNDSKPASNKNSNSTNSNDKSEGNAGNQEGTESNGVFSDDYKPPKKAPGISSGSGVSNISDSDESVGGWIGRGKVGTLHDISSR